MLWSLTFSLLIAISLGFMLLAYRFDRTMKKNVLGALSSFPMISVIVPTYNSEKTVGKTLESIKNSNYPNTEIIVVNDSNDKTPEIVKEFGAKLIQNTKRCGKGAAINTAAKSASGEFLLVLDADATLQKNTLSTLVKSYTNYSEAGEMVGIVAPKYTASNKKNFIARMSDMEQKLHQNLMKIQMNLGSIISIRGSCMLIPRAAFNAAGGFSSTLLEDGDFTAKIIKAGYKIKYEPRTMVKINEPETLSSFLSAKKRYGKGTFYCASSHKKPYIFSAQAAICFYPQALLMIAVIGTLIFQNPLTIAPIAMLLASFAVVGATSYIMIAAIAAVSVIGILFFGTNVITATTGAQTGTLSAFLPFVLVIAPLVGLMYMRGMVSGIVDKINGIPELDFSNW